MPSIVTASSRQGTGAGADSTLGRIGLGEGAASSA